MVEELIPNFPLEQHRMNKMHKVKGGPPSRDYDQMGVKIKRKTRDNTWSNQVERLREERSRASHRSSPWFIPRLDNSWQEEGAESEHREVGMHNRFPCFSRRLALVRLPHKFKLSNHSKYDGKTEPKQWLRIYSQSIELASGDDDIKALFFPMALENMPL
jgi:hypothetical protein